MSLHRYLGALERAYAQLVHGTKEELAVAPFTVGPGDVVDFGDQAPPKDGHWSEPLAGKDAKGVVPKLPDNHPDVIDAANAAAAAPTPVSDAPSEQPVPAPADGPSDTPAATATTQE